MMEILSVRQEHKERAPYPEEEGEEESHPGEGPPIRENWGRVIPWRGDMSKGWW